MGPETSHVNAPAGSQYMFCAATLHGESVNVWATVDNATKGGATATSMGEEEIEMCWAN